MSHDIQYDLRQTRCPPSANPSHPILIPHHCTNARNAHRDYRQTSLNNQPEQYVPRLAHLTLVPLMTHCGDHSLAHSYRLTYIFLHTFQQDTKSVSRRQKMRIIDTPTFVANRLFLNHSVSPEHQTYCWVLPNPTSREKS